MAAATTSLFKTNSILTTDSSSILTLPSIISKATKLSSLLPISCLSLPLKPIKLHLECSSSTNFFLPSFSLKKRPLLTFFAAQEDSTVVLEETEEEEELKWENEESDDGAISGEFAEEGEGGEDVAEVEPPEEAKLFVGNLPYDVDSENLAELFNQAGVVEIAEVIYNRETDQSRGFGFVSMSTVEEAEKAVEMLNGYDIKGRLLTVNKAAPRGSRPERLPRDVEPSKRLYVGNLPWEVDNARLEQIFSEHGKVLQARVVFDRESGRSRGFGFVTMSTDAELQDAIVALDGKSLEGRAIRVNVAEERPRRNF